MFVFTNISHIVLSTTRSTKYKNDVAQNLLTQKAIIKTNDDDTTYEF